MGHGDPRSQTIIIDFSQGCSFPQDLRTISAQGLPANVGGVVSDYVISSVSYSPGERNIQVFLSELNLSTGQKELAQYNYSTSFDITCASTNPGGRFLYVAGIRTDTNCEDIVEQWKFPLVNGSYSVTQTSGFTPIGTPRGPYSAYISIQGGTYIPHDQRSSPPGLTPFPQKKELVSGSFGHFDKLVVDPERRYVLLRSFADRSIYKLPLVQPYALELEASSADHPHLLSVESMGVFDLDGVGRFVHLSEEFLGWVPITAKDTIMLDSDNDGNFDSITTFGFASWQGSPYYNDRPSWASPFRVEYTEPN